MAVHGRSLATNADARNRAWRTFAQGLLVDLLLAGGAALMIAVSAPDFAWSKAYWSGVGLAVAKTLVSTAVAFLARKVAPPPA